jgi:hypothetical protein
MRQSKFTEAQITAIPKETDAGVSVRHCLPDPERIAMEAEEPGSATVLRCNILELVRPRRFAMTTVHGREGSRDPDQEGRRPGRSTFLTPCPAVRNRVVLSSPS